MEFHSLAAEAKDLGLCKDCTCVKPVCNHPKSRQECQACANAVKKDRISMQNGFCWILSKENIFQKINRKQLELFSVDTTSEGDCALRTFSKLSGCTGFAGYTHYGNKNCWARWRPGGGGRKRRDVVNFWERDSL